MKRSLFHKEQKTHHLVNKKTLRKNKCSKMFNLRNKKMKLKNKKQCLKNKHQKFRILSRLKKKDLQSLIKTKSLMINCREKNLIFMDLSLFQWMMLMSLNLSILYQLWSVVFYRRFEKILNYMLKESSSRKWMIKTNLKEN